MTLAYWILLITALLPIGCAAYAKRLAGFTLADNHNPRAFLARATDKAARADAAQKNSYETYPPFAAVVIIAHLTGGAAQQTINAWALVFLISRLIFIYSYISDRPTLRSAFFGINLLCIIALYIAAA